MDPWLVTPAEKLRHAEQFRAIGPVGGFVTGDQAKGFLMQSQLPVPILGQIWSMADADGDGRMDLREFSVACKLITNKLMGFEIPPALPPQLRILLSAPPTPVATTPIKDPTPIASPIGDGWSVPMISRNQYRQVFGEKSRGGFVSGVEARGVFISTGLPQNILAQIWALADMDSDGRLGAEEFVLALHLCDLAKMGRLPSGKLPPDLIPPGFRKESSRRGSEVEATSPPSFEDKRKENYDRGQAELDRRRRALADAAEMEKKERERKEREEFERREKARLEAERRKEAEVEAALTLAREAEQRRLEELKRAEEHREAARIESERKRRAELQDNHRNELLNRRLKEQEDVLRLKGVHHALSLDLNIMGEKVKDFSTRITETRGGVSSVKSEIDGMRSRRDALMAESAELKSRLKDQNAHILAAAQEKIRLEKAAANVAVKSSAVKTLKEKLNVLVEENTKRREEKAKVDEEAGEIAVALDALVTSCRDLFNEYKEKRMEVVRGRKKAAESFDYNAAWGSASHAAPEPVYVEDEKPKYYRALFDFESRNPDELSFAAGDIITKDTSVVPDPGWLAGRLGDSAGWFPESFVEILEETENEKTNGEIAEIPEEVQVHDFGTRYISVYPYESAETGDLPFEAGEEIWVTANEGEWWTGSIGDRKGVFPANYVSLPDAIPPPTADHVEQHHEQFQQATVESSYFPSEASEIDGRLKEAEALKSLEDAIEPELERINSQRKKSRYEIATVLCNYTASSESQLSLVRGQLITVRKKRSEGWWEGELQAKGKKRQIGWFPASYVKVLGPGGSGSRQSSSRTTPVHFDYEPPTMEAPILDNIPTSPAPPQMMATNEQVVALYPYVSQNPDELTFEKGDVIMVMSKDEPDWWRGQVLGSAANGLFPVNYVQPVAIASDSIGREAGAEPYERQLAVNELLSSENAYLDDMRKVQEVFYSPLYSSGLLTHDELNIIFLNWDEIMERSGQILKAFAVRKRHSATIVMVGDILQQLLPSLLCYIRFCSAQLTSAALIQKKLGSDKDFAEFCRRAQELTDHLPLTSFLLKPIQRITRYPLLIKKILAHTPQIHPDRENCELALEKAEELCAQVNEGVREKENSDRLEWLQTHVVCEGLEERLIFNSLTNSQGPRKLIHFGCLKKTKSGKELVGFLFNDFILLAQASKPLGSAFSFDRHRSLKLKMYKKPYILTLEMKMWEEDDIGFNVNGTSLLTSTTTERTLWVKHVKEAHANFVSFENKFLQRQRTRNVHKRKVKGSLRVVIIEGVNLAHRDKNGKSDPYVEASLGPDIKRTSVIKATLNPQWNASFSFSVMDLDQDVLCFTVFDKDYYAPNQFLGRCELWVSKIHEEMGNSHRTPVTKKLQLHEVESGEILVKIHLQIFE